MSAASVESFTSAPIKLAAAIMSKRQAAPAAAVSITPTTMDCDRGEAAAAASREAAARAISRGKERKKTRQLAASQRTYLCFSAIYLLLMPVLVGRVSSTSDHHEQQQQQQQHYLRHQTHYLSIVPSTHFSYKEGRQLHHYEQPAHTEHVVSAAAAAAAAGSVAEGAADSQHIYKRSSALLSTSSQQQQQQQLHYAQLIGGGGGGSTGRAGGSSGPLRRRMMNSNPAVAATAETQGRWLSSQPDEQQQQQQPPSDEPASRDAMPAKRRAEQRGEKAAAAGRQRPAHEEAELLRQKQHIQYHDQWPSMAGKCHKRTLNFCASVLPFNTTTFPNIIGDTNRFEVKRSLPFFGFLAKSSCNKRLDELLCLLLEPPCQPNSGQAIPPCKKFCRLALEGCNEYIPATLAMSSVFDCRQYPDSSDPGVCINLASGSKCAHDEFKCPDKTCIPKNWLCDGVRDCLFAADEANCTAPAGIGGGLQASVCSTEEFKCDGKCVPKAWKCDGERDCLDGTDEESCDQRPRCGPDRFRCADGNGCLPKRWVCDGKAECRDGSDELNCEQLECSENDFKCDNGICIPKIWRCDRQFDCKDGSDERSCVYPTNPPPSTTSTTTTTTSSSSSGSTTSTTQALQSTHEQAVINANSSSVGGIAGEPSVETTTPIGAPSGPAKSMEPTATTLLDGGQSGAASLQRQQLGAQLNEDVSRIIQQETASHSPLASALVDSSSNGEPAVAASSSSAPPDQPLNQQQQQQQQQPLQAKELKKFDYDLLGPSATATAAVASPAPAAANSIAHSDDGATAATNVGQRPQMLQQVDFVAQPPARQQPAALDFELRRQQQQPLASLEQPIERVPIYRSLFKAFKGDHQAGPAALVAASNSPQASHRYAVRRRRDRAHLKSQAQQQLQQQQPHELATVGGAAAAELGVIALQQPQPQNQTARAVGHGVASYLQLLNNRYNLRLSRAAHHSHHLQQQQQQAASPQTLSSSSSVS